jgi:endonuclease/exonuclease/phosphatase (EEP) superfamily protein YafD
MSPKRLRRALLWVATGWLLVSLSLSAAIRLAPRVGSWLLFVEYVPPLPGIVFSGVLLIAAARLRAGRALIAAGVASLVMAGPVGGGAAHLALPARRGDVSVVTFNVAKWTLGFDEVLALLERAAPDVFCLQEAGAYDWDPHANEREARFRARFAGYQLARAGELLVGSRLPIVGEELVTLPDNPSSRPLLSVTLRSSEGRSMTVMVAHLIYTNAFPSTPLGLLRAAEARRQQALAIGRYAASQSTPLVLCGDLNTAPSSATVRELRQHFDDAFAERGLGWGLSSEPGPIARRLDYVFARGLSARQAHYLPAQGSDHRALWVVLGVNE